MHIADFLVLKFVAGLCRACLEFLKISGRQPEIIHAHEWQLSAVPMLYWYA